MRKVIAGLVLVVAPLAMANPVVTTTKTVSVITNTTSSCLGSKSVPAVKDIDKSYFRISRTEFTRFDAEQPLVLLLIRIKVDLPNQTPYVCEFSGESLLALHSQWYKDRQARIPANVERFALDCAITCGGINYNDKFSAIATIEAFGANLHSTEAGVSHVMQNKFELRRF